MSRTKLDWEGLTMRDRGRYMKIRRIILEPMPTYPEQLCPNMDIFPSKKGPQVGNLSEVSNFVIGLPDRERKVISYRYGLLDGRRRTLEEVGGLLA